MTNVLLLIWNYDLIIFVIKSAERFERLWYWKVLYKLKAVVAKIFYGSWIKGEIFHKKYFIFGRSLLGKIATRWTL